MDEESNQTLPTPFSTKLCALAFFCVSRGHCFYSHHNLLCCRIPLHEVCCANRSVHTTFNRVAKLSIKCVIVLYSTKPCQNINRHMECNVRWNKKQICQRGKYWLIQKNERSDSQQRVTSRLLNGKRRQRPLRFHINKSTFSSLILFLFYPRFQDDCKCYCAELDFVQRRKSVPIDWHMNYEIQLSNFWGILILKVRKVWSKNILRNVWVNSSLNGIFQQITECQ